MSAAARPSYRFDPALIAASDALRELANMPARWVCWRYIKRGTEVDEAALPHEWRHRRQHGPRHVGGLQRVHRCGQGKR